MLKQQKAKGGFTIIEVVLVLAIAGLIFLMVFLALPNLQRSQKDTQRRDDMASFQTAITNYQSNNRGKLPGTNSLSSENAYKDAYESFITNYLRAGGDSFTDPDGEDYVIGTVCPNFKSPGQYANECKDMSTTDTKFDDSGHKIYVYQNATCDGENITASTGTRKVAFLYKMEGGGWYCGNN